jgi:protein associated with RNAse G/E
MQNGKKMFKVITPIEKDGKNLYWMRLGSAYTNKDESINVYLDAIPVNQKEWKLQLREMDEEDFKKKDGSLAARPTLPLNLPTPSSAAHAADVPF